MAHDMVVIGAGTTPVFDSLSAGASMKRPERREILGPLVDALEEGIAGGLFRAEHFLHMRCEISDPETIALTDANIGRAVTRLASVMDHTPGDRQTLDVTRAPARPAGLSDRGEIRPGLMADLLHVRRRGGRNHIAAVWRSGARVL